MDRADEPSLPSPAGHPMVEWEATDWRSRDFSISTGFLQARSPGIFPGQLIFHILVGSIPVSSHRTEWARSGHPGGLRPLLRLVPLETQRRPARRPVPLLHTGPLGVDHPLPPRPTPGHTGLRDP